MKPPILIDLPEELVSERLKLRPYRDGDGAALNEAIVESRELLMPWMPWAHRQDTPEDSEATIRKFRAAWITRDDMPLGIWRKEDGRFLGGTGLHRMDWEVRKFEIGYWLRASEQGKGYVTESTKLLTDFAFSHLEANRVFLRVLSHNERSQAIPRRLGFVHEGTLRNDMLDALGNVSDMMFFGMTRQDWLNRQS